jgi:hypothetical protein
MSDARYAVPMIANPFSKSLKMLKIEYPAVMW